jgi:hypothetical protein
MPKPRPLAERFWEKVNKLGSVPSHRPEIGPCWIWTAAKTSAGYGVLATGHSNPTLAHRIAWELSNGRSADNRLCVCHHCDNRVCVRPDHLFIGTYQDNILDMLQKGRRPYYSRLSEDDLQKIKSSTETQRTLATRYSVDPSYISRIKSGSRRGTTRPCAD